MATTIATQAGRVDQVPAVVDRVREMLESGEFDRAGEVYAQDALVDANVPGWRLQRQGLRDIIAQLREWYSEPARFLSWQARPTGWGAVVEVEEMQRDHHDHEDLYFREVHLFTTRNDRVVEHTIYCTGGWDAETVGRQRAEAPMVRF